MANYDRVLIDPSSAEVARSLGEGFEGLVPSFPCEPKDLTGAGDMFAGAFLYGITHGFSADEAARAAGYLSQKVILQVGARLHHGTREYWDEGLTKT